MDGEQKKRGSGYYLKGSVTVETAYILPSIILIFLLVVYTVFYYHDKNILNGVAGEVAVVGAQAVREKGKEEPDLQSLLKERVSGKLVLLRLTKVEAAKSKTKVEVSAYAAKRWMRVMVVQRAAISKPEEKIRKKRQLVQ